MKPLTKQKDNMLNGRKCLQKKMTDKGLIFPGGLDSKAYAHNVGDPSLIPGLGRSPGEGNGSPL